MADKAEEKKIEDQLDIPADDKEIDTPPEGYTEEEWSDLSDAEKEGIRDNGEEEVEEKSEVTEEELKSIAEEGEKAEEVKEGEAVIPEPEVKKLDEPVIEAKKDEASTQLSDAELLNLRPVIDESKLPSPEPEVIPAEVQAQIDELDKKYDDGDITLKEYNKDRDAINRQIVSENIHRNQVRREAARADLIWQSEQIAFFKARPEYEYKPDGTLRGKALYGALNQAIMALDSDSGNTGLRGMELLLKADKVVKDAFGLSSPPAKEQAQAKATAKEEKPAARIPDVKSLGDLPTAGSNDTGGAWGGLDRLSGEAYEAALERLTPTQRDAYLAAR